MTMCMNVVQISGSEEDINKFVDLMTEGFDYGKVIPMPSEIRDTSCPTQIITQAEFEEQERHLTEITKGDRTAMMHLRRGITKEMQQDLERRYYCDNWHKWAMRYWEVDWNNTPNGVTFCRGRNIAIWEFRSPSRPPKPVYRKLRESYPLVDIDWWYGGPEMSDSGWLYTELREDDEYGW